MSEDQTKKPEEAKSPEARHSDARRRLLKTIAVGGAAGAAVPDKWTKPVVDAVLLPAHAVATGCTITGFSVVVDENNVPLGTFNAGQTVAVAFSDASLLDFDVTVNFAGTPGGNINLDVSGVANWTFNAGQDQTQPAGATVDFANVTVDWDGDQDEFQPLTFTITGCGSPQNFVINFTEEPT